ncbi:Uncharacterised protein [Mycobacteroides abscessus subsp. abscessus]|nr:Uncharacterised protein [Mycobacteroides abscessus subsp. abscessus]
MAGPAVKVPLDTLALVDTCDICAPVSEEPTPSITIALGRAATSRPFTAGVNSAPPLATMTSEVGSWLPSAIASSIAVTRGRAMASPTTVAIAIFSRAMVSTISLALKPSTSLANTMVWPLLMPVITPHCAAPCISGGRIIIRISPAAEARSTISWADCAGSPVIALRPPNEAMKMSCWRHRTPLGIPVVPPVYST